MRSQHRFYLQSPVGNGIPVVSLISLKANVQSGFSTIPGWKPYWYGSGTMAVAAAVKVACVHSNSRQPKIALAAYGCPDLVSAIQFAGAKPVYIDLIRDRLSMDPDLLSQALAADDDICAVIGTDLFGIPENWAGLRRIVSESQALLIQDCAQSVQRRTLFQNELHGDLVAFSFGRGKPVCLLSGGALLVPEDAAEDILASLGNLSQISAEAKIRFSIIRSTLYNLLIQPRLYSVSSMIMGDRLGQTVFIRLDAIQRLSEVDIARANVGIEYLWDRHKDKSAEIVKAIRKVIREFPSQVRELLPRQENDLADRLYSRLPLLMRSASTREKTITNLAKNGICATAMYGRILPDIVNASDCTQLRHDFPIARRLADRLITLPVHIRLTVEDVNVIASTLRVTLGRNDADNLMRNS